MCQTSSFFRDLNFMITNLNLQSAVTFFKCCFSIVRREFTLTYTDVTQATLLNWHFGMGVLL